MFGIQALDVVISLIFIYLLFSLFVSVVNEILSQFFQVRGKELRFSIERMIGYALRKQFYQHPKINRTQYRSSIFYGTPLWKLYAWIREKISSNIDFGSKDIDKKITNKASPSNISTGTFADTLIDLIQDEAARKELFKQAPFLEKIYQKAEGDVEALREAIENWFDEIMVYTSEWYKQKLRYILLVLGFLTAAAFNVDSVSIFKTLANNPETRGQVVQQAEGFIDSHNLEDGIVVPVTVGDSAASSDTLYSNYAIRDFLESRYEACGGSEQCRKSVNEDYPTLARIDSTYMEVNRLVHEDIEQLSTVLGIGWGSWNGATGWLDWIVRVLGWLVTAIAISLGAPFWFDLLKRVINLKNEITKEKGTTTKTKTE
ncbi:hypothetical protein NC796_15010 [Aliifodinibius sp. S!AR15-10]|uniref:hypothetical protein n=1 Tax=Aliifodinibius sp. S!AR15-10 TaxID=2950437 RepID=UPI00285A0108|nr:hypothetical protein [Aliifodinibius sp. S!AR15-10]MDR8392462.1 hypothetical protein [Aliifodinibius sp. S!AR15-10]